MKVPSNRVLSAAFGALIPMGCAIGFWVMMPREFKGAETWPRVPAKITKAVAGKVVSRAGGRTSVWYAIECEYTYEFNQTPFKGGRYSVEGIKFDGEAEAKAAAVQLKNQPSPMVHVDPLRPEVSVIVPNYNSMMYTIATIVGGAVAIGTWIYAAIVWKRE